MQTKITTSDLPAVEANPPNLSEESIATLYATGFELYRNGKYEDAKAFFRMLTLLEPTTIRYWFGLAACHQMLKHFDEAIDCYGIAAVQDPDDPYIHWHAADCFYQAGKKKMALKTLTSAIATAKQGDRHVDLVAKLELLHTVWSKDTRK